MIYLQNKNQIHQLYLLQQNLSSIRKIAGWTAEELGSKIGVTKQTISNLENNKTTMTLSQYIAIRTVIDYQIENDPGNTVLPQAVKILLDGHETISSEEYAKAKKAIETAALSAAGGVSGVTLATIFSSVLGSSAGVSALLSSSVALGPLGFVAGGAVAGTALWVKKLMKNKDNKNGRE